MVLRVPLARRALEQTFGLALEAVTDQEISRAVDLAAGAGPLDWEDPGFLARLVDQLPIDESSLFRNEGLWRWLAGELPAWLDGAMARGRPLRALSLGCSFGQEVFSLAMLLIAELRRRGIPSTAASGFATVWGVDASEARLAAARSGLVRAWSVQRAALEWTQGYLHPDPADPTRYQVDPAVLAVTSFERRNLVELVEQPSALGGHAVILCQHVLVYFREQTALQVLRRLALAADPGTVIITSPIEAHLLTQVEELERLPQVGAARRRGLMPPRVKPRPAPAKSGEDGASTGPARTEPAGTAQPERSRGPLLHPPPAVGREGGSTSSARPQGVQPERGRGPPAHQAAAAGAGASSAEASVRLALELAAAGRFAESLAAARAACDADPGHLVARFLVGQALLSVDPPQGRRVLQELSQAVARLDQSTALPWAAELSVEQLASAVSLLLEERK